MIDVCALEPSMWCHLYKHKEYIQDWLSVKLKTPREVGCLY